MVMEDFKACLIWFDNSSANSQTIYTKESGAFYWKRRQTNLSRLLEHRTVSSDAANNGQGTYNFLDYLKNLTIIL
jgi:hypothetical protein